MITKRDLKLIFSGFFAGASLLFMVVWLKYYTLFTLCLLIGDLAVAMLFANSVDQEDKRKKEDGSLKNT